MERSIASLLTRLRARPDEPLRVREVHDLSLAQDIAELRESGEVLSPECRALLLLWNDGLEGCHAIAQDLPSSTGSYLHAMMHRREGDFPNALYWLRQAGAHPVLQRLGEALADRQDLLALPQVAPLLRGGAFDAAAFVDACERLPEDAALRAVQRLELESLWSCCHPREV